MKLRLATCALMITAAFAATGANAQDKKALAQQESFAFAVGARITVPAGTVEGVYVGDIEVTVQYP